MVVMNVRYSQYSVEVCLRNASLLIRTNIDLRHALLPIPNDLPP